MKGKNQYSVTKEDVNTMPFVLADVFLTSFNKLLSNGFS